MTDTQQASDEPIGYVSAGWAEHRVGHATVYPQPIKCVGTYPVYAAPAQADSAPIATDTACANWKNPGSCGCAVTCVGAVSKDETDEDQSAEWLEAERAALAFRTGEGYYFNGVNYAEHP